MSYKVKSMEYTTIQTDRQTWLAALIQNVYTLMKLATPTSAY